jgi:hypothetical protein
MQWAGDVQHARIGLLHHADRLGSLLFGSRGNLTFISGCMLAPFDWLAPPSRHSIYSILFIEIPVWHLILVWAAVSRRRSATVPQNQVQPGSVFASLQWNSILGRHRDLLGQYAGKESPTLAQVHQISRLVRKDLRHLEINCIDCTKFLLVLSFNSCKEFQNLNAFFALVMGLSNVAVSRLTQTWERLPSKVFPFAANSQGNLPNRFCWL